MVAFESLGFRLNSTVPLSPRKIPRPWQLDNPEGLQRRLGREKVNRGCGPQNTKNGWGLCLSNSNIERSSGSAGDPPENTGPIELEMPRIEI